ncbi:MAG: RNA methyltransferase, partial [Eudoraea sp.]|nr:RNA methyltransferase [Eudoraea sp.]
MKPVKHISSTQNPEIRELITIKEKKKGRSSSGLFVLEGIREFDIAREAGSEFDKFFMCPDIISEELASECAGHYPDVELISVSKSVYERIAYRGKTEGWIALAFAKDHSLTDLPPLSAQPLILVAESPEKPGNVGALLRTADAAQLDAVLIADPISDLYNPNTVRSSVGCLFSVPIATASSEDIIAFLKERKISIFAATLQEAGNYVDRDYSGPTA